MLDQLEAMAFRGKEERFLDMSRRCKRRSENGVRRGIKQANSGLSRTIRGKKEFLNHLKNLE
jgi:hypothetical protein